MDIYLIAVLSIFGATIYNLIRFIKEFRETMDDSDMEID